MRKLKLQIQMTIDGFVAGPNGELDWMNFEPDEESFAYINEMIDSSDCILLGRKMTDGFIDHWKEALEKSEDKKFSFPAKMINTPKYVFSKTIEESNWVNTTLVNSDLVEEVNKLKNTDGKDIIVYGGADFVSSLIKNNLIDEYHLIINPVAIGKGLAIFGDTENYKHLELIRSKVYKTQKLLSIYIPK